MYNSLQAHQNDKLFEQYLIVSNKLKQFGGRVYDVMSARTERLFLQDNKKDLSDVLRKTVKFSGQKLISTD